MRDEADHNNLTKPNDWERIHGLHIYSKEELLTSTNYPWIDNVINALKAYENQDYIELGCVPGKISALLSCYIRMKYHGIDSCLQRDQYLSQMRATGNDNVVFYEGDVRSFYPETLFDVVCSFGLIEHFREPSLILKHHDRLLRRGGLCIVVVPNFRWLPGLYHRIFDRTSMSLHNTAAMRRQVFVRFAKECSHDILQLKYSGGFELWGEDAHLGTVAKRFASRIRSFAAKINTRIPSDSPITAPYLLYMGKKK
jgi:SAM-dependent methyltransferase